MKLKNTMTREAFESGQPFCVIGTSHKEYVYSKPPHDNEYASIISESHLRCLVLKIEDDGFTIYANILGVSIEAKVLFDKCIIYNI